jgi:hypothetical protein
LQEIVFPTTVDVARYRDKKMIAAISLSIGGSISRAAARRLSAQLLLPQIGMRA